MRKLLLIAAFGCIQSMFIKKGVLYHLVAAVIHLGSEQSDLLAAVFWNIQVMIISLALSRLCGYFMQCLVLQQRITSLVYV